MRLVGIATVKNEADIVEAFVRHNLAVLDLLLAVDDGSGDATGDVLRALSRDGLPIVVEHAPSLPGCQARSASALARRAAEEHGADWVVPLNADEFLGVGFREALATAAPDEPVGVPYRTYCLHAADDPAELNPVLRLRAYRDAEPDRIQKCSLPANLAIALGHGGGDHPASVEHLTRPLTGQHLARYPVRSFGQFAARVIIGACHRAAVSFDQVGVESSWFAHEVERICADPQRYRTTLRQASRRYALAPTAPEPGLTFQPWDYLGGALKYTERNDDTASLVVNLARYAEFVAAAWGEQRHQPNADTTATIIGLEQGVRQRRAA
jgi:hypothetical protein